MFKEDDLRQAWSVEANIVFDGQRYRVGRMSYGDYFLEPGKPQGETQPFNNGTLWLELKDSKKRLYGVAYELDGEGYEK